MKLIFFLLMVLWIWILPNANANRHDLPHLHNIGYFCDSKMENCISVSAFGHKIKEMDEEKEEKEEEDDDDDEDREED